MLIRMLKTVAGSEDGAVTRTFFVHEVYDLGHTPRSRELVSVLVREGWAQNLDALVDHLSRELAPRLDEKAKEAPDNKAIQAAPRNKGRGR